MSKVDYQNKVLPNLPKGKRSTLLHN